MIDRPELDSFCSKYFCYRDLVCCGETYEQGDVKNIPQQSETWHSIKELAINVLDPVREYFGSLQLTYGLATPELVSAIRRRARKENRTPNIYPSLDQHAGSELDSRGTLVCRDQGLACDFYCDGVSSELVADWVIKECNFDKLYYYGSNRPIHVSVSLLRRKSVVLVRRKERKVTPKVILPEQFLELSHWVESP
ncbi:hypothetical protein [Endozoicomonas atrinae]|uniref:hypothetical protein n=1 Tax=Endozoicomonas atrinae TaxID=1333660 RepID=UPI003AFFD1E6